MQSVITADQARQICGGPPRISPMPVEYETAIKMLAACIEIDEAKYFDNQADALAAWAKIYHSDDALRKARQLKLHAYRRMGQISEQLAAARGVGKGRRAPVSAVLIDHGMTRCQARQARHLSKLPAQEFQRILEMPKVPAPHTVTRMAMSGSEGWKLISILGSGPTNFRSFCRKHNAVELARSLTADERSKAREIAVEIAEWIDDFERAL